LTPVLRAPSPSPATPGNVARQLPSSSLLISWRGRAMPIAAVLVLVLLLGMTTLPLVTPQKELPPDDLAILPAVMLRDQVDSEVQEITGGEDPLTGASGVAVGADGSLYVIDVPRNQVRVFNADGTPRTTWGTSGDGPGEFGFSFDFPWGDLAIAPDGNLYVVDPNLARVQKFTPDGTFLLGFGERGSEDEQLLYPYGIAVGPDNHVYVADYQNHRVQVFAGDGTFLASWDGAEAEGPSLAGPADVAVGPDGTVWVADDILQKVFGFAADGTVVATFGKAGANPGEMHGPSGIAVDPDGSVYIADKGNDRIQKFAPDGSLLGMVGTRGEGPGQLTQPVSVAFGPDGAVYVTEDGVGRVQRFAAESLEQPVATPGTAGSN
jgi:DNA-binding beta-propeller fold protein YncE